MNISAAHIRSSHADLTAVANLALKYASCSKAANTVLAYKSDLAHFAGWCQLHGLTDMPASPDTLRLYLSDSADNHKPSTLSRRLASISQAHKIAGHASPAKDAKVREVMAGIRRMKGIVQDAKTPILVEDLKQIVNNLPDNVIGYRDRALFLIGFGGAFRRSELVGLDKPDVEITRHGLVIRVRRSKTDQEGQGRNIGIPFGSHPETCPGRAFQVWMEKSGIVDGPVFRPINRHGKILNKRLSTNGVAGIVKCRIKGIGLDASRFAGHSLRSGLATSAALAGASERSIMKQTGHRSVVMVRRYIRDGGLFKDNVVSSLGL